MSLERNQKYDLIVMDAFESGYCAPAVFYNQKYVFKLKQHLTRNGIFALNTLPECERHEEELSIYTRVFDNFYTSETISSNKIILFLNGRTPQLEDVKRNADAMQPTFALLDVNTAWIMAVFHFNAKRLYGVCDYYAFVREIFHSRL